MNYRHHFHAGNFADVFKHAVLLAVVAALKRRGRPLRVIETHAGAGLYDLRGEHARKANEAEAGVMRLMADPAAPSVFDALKTAIQRENPDGQVALYPGSPSLLTGALEPGDIYEGCELRPDDQQALAELFERRRAKSAKAVLADGYAYAASATVSRGETLVVIDPPFEQGDEYDRIVQTAALLAARGAVLAIWTPMKDLETLDALISRLELINSSSLTVGEVRLRPLTDPMKMNGCAMILLGVPEITPQLEACAEWVVANCGEAGGTAKVSVA